MNPNGIRFEYGINRAGDDLSDVHGPHRANMTREEAETWLREWEEMGGRREVFALIRRPIGVWERFSESDNKGE